MSPGNIANHERIGWLDVLLGVFDNFRNMGSEANLNAGVPPTGEIVLHRVDFAFMPQIVGGGSVMVDTCRTGRGEDADILEDIGHLRSGPGYPVKPTPWRRNSSRL